MLWGFFYSFSEAQMVFTGLTGVCWSWGPLGTCWVSAPHSFLPGSVASRAGTIISWSLRIPGWSWTPFFVVQDDPELRVLLLPPPKCCDHRHTHTAQGLSTAGDHTGGLVCDQSTLPSLPSENTLPSPDVSKSNGYKESLHFNWADLSLFMLPLLRLHKVII